MNTALPHGLPTAAAHGRASAPLVVMLSAAHPPEDVRVVAKEGAALVAAGWRVLHVCPAPPLGTSAPSQAWGVFIATFPRGRGWGARLLDVPSLARRARRTGAAVLHASEPDAWLAAILAARGGRSRVVLDVHEHYPSRLDPRLPSWARPAARAAIRLACRTMARAVDAVVVAKDGLDADFRAADRTIAVRNYAEDLPVPPRRHTHGGPLSLLHLGALTRARGAEVMLDALALCTPGTRLSLLGRFTDNSEEEFSARVRSLGLADRVDRSAWRPRAEALTLAATADVGLLLFQPGVENHRLALPHKLFDYMLAGLPVIAPAFATEVAAVVRDSGCGLLVDAADPTSIAAAVAELGDPARRATLGAAGRHAARSRFGWTAEAERLVDLYQRLAPLPAPG